MAAVMVPATSTAEIAITILVPAPLPGKSWRTTPIVLRITAHSARQMPRTWNAVMSAARTSTAGNLPLAAAGCRRQACNTSPTRCEELLMRTEELQATGDLAGSAVGGTALFIREAHD